MTGFWDSEEKVERLKQLWTDGLSAGRIAQVLGGGLSRSAVIGKVHRLGLAGRVIVSGPRTERIYPARRNRVVPVTPRAKRREMLGEPHPEAATLPSGARVGTADLAACHCRWPHGEVGDPGFHYCGLTPAKGSPWCEYHLVRATETAHPPSPERGSLGRKAEAQFAKMWG